MSSDTDFPMDWSELFGDEVPNAAAAHAVLMRAVIVVFDRGTEDDRDYHTQWYSSPGDPKRLAAKVAEEWQGMMELANLPRPFDAFPYNANYVGRLYAAYCEASAEERLQVRATAWGKADAE